MALWALLFLVDTCIKSFVFHKMIILINIWLLFSETVLGMVLVGTGVILCVYDKSRWHLPVPIYFKQISSLEHLSLPIWTHRTVHGYTTPSLIRRNWPSSSDCSAFITYYARRKSPSSYDCRLQSRLVLPWKEMFFPVNCITRECFIQIYCIGTKGMLYPRPTSMSISNLSCIGDFEQTNVYDDGRYFLDIYCINV